MDFLSEINVNTKEIALKEDIDKLDNSKLNTTDAAASANKINTDAGSVTQPVYFKDGVPVETTYTLAKSVPSDAVFTDTKYTHPSYTAKSSGLYKVTVDSTGHVSSVTAVTKADITALGIPASDTNTHYTSKNVVNSSNTSTSNTETALTNGNVYLISVENGAVTSAHKISGSGATTVTTDTSGNIVINSIDTKYTHPTTSGNKHIPSGGSSGQILRWSADGTAVWGADNNTTYTTFVKSGSGAKAGLVPAPSTTAGTTKYLREDGTWSVPPDTNTTYTSLKNPYALTIQGNGTTLTNGTYDGSAAKTVNITPSSIGAAASSHGTHVTFTTTTPKANGTAAVGSATTVSRSDHVHPLQTSVSGNAGTATKWATARNINGLSVDGTANRVNYGTCSTAAATAAKVVACTGFALVTGAEITVKFTVTNTAASPTLNVNNTGAKAIYYRGSAISAGYLAANRTYTFRYNGTQYDLVGDINTDTNTDTKNTTGSTNTSSKIYLIGATSQTTNPVTYSHDTVFVDSGGVLNSSSGIKLNSNGMYLDSWANFICGSSLYSGCSWHMDNSDGTNALKLYPHEEQKTLEINNRTKFSYGARVYSGTLSSGSATVTITNLWDYTLLIAVAYSYGYLNSSSTASTDHVSYTSFTIPIPVQYINGGNIYTARLPIDEHVYTIGVGSQIEISKSSTANSLGIKKKDDTTVKLGTWSIYAVI